MDPLHELLKLEALGIKFGLDNITALIQALGRPDASFRTVLIAGTNGKGSVTAMVDSSLRVAGVRTGRYTSPHLVHLEERFTIMGQPVGRPTLRRAVTRTLDAATQLVAEGQLASLPTFFEACTATALTLFEEARIDVAVLEVGLGGRLDATNAVSPVVSAITSIAKDHEQLLGTTLGAIAREKAGVIRAGVPTVIGQLPPEALSVVEQQADALGAPLRRADREIAHGVRVDDGLTTMTDVRSATRRYGDIRLALRGRHQTMNAAVAIGVLESLQGLGVPVPVSAVATGLSSTDWRGRLELLTRPDGRRLWLDAGHNPAGAEALAAYLREVCPARLPLVFGAMADKDLEAMIGALSERASHFVFTKPSGARAARPDHLAEIAARVAPGVPVEVVDAPATALERAWAFGTTICATGSIFLVGELLEALEADA